MERDLELRCVIEKDGSMFSALCLDLDVATCGGTLEETIESMKDAISAYLDYASASGRYDELVPRLVPRDIMKHYMKKISKSSSDHHERLRPDRIMGDSICGDRVVLKPQYAF